MPNVRGLTEIVLFVRDIEKSLEFYRDTLGLKVMAQPDARAAVFLLVGERAEGVPQQLVLVPLPAGSPPFPNERPRRPLHHLGMEIPGSEFEGERERLASLGYDVRLGDHPFLPVRGMYIDDPDGNEVELIASK